jgi:hypothetical protein
MLRRATLEWQPPKVARGGYTRDRGDRAQERATLIGQAAQWRTPLARDWRSPVPRRAHRRPGQNWGGLNDQVSAFSLRGRATTQIGPTASPNGRKSNPQFWEALMGWPIGWTEPASPAKGLSRWWRLMPTALSVLVSTPPMRADGQIIMGFAA